MALYPRSLSDVDRKKFVAQVVAKCLEATDDYYLMNDVIDVEVHPVSNLQTQIRVKTRNAGTHYYTVKVSEML